MDLHEDLLGLVDPLRVGSELLPGVVLDDASTDLGLRLRFRVGDDRVWVDIGPLERMRRYAARSERLGFGYRTEGGRGRVDPASGKRLCEALAALVRANEDSVIARIRALARAEADPAARVRQTVASRALEPSGPIEAPYYSLNPYVGCIIGCRFCYAQTPIAAMRTLLDLRDFEWGAFVDVRGNLDALLRRELAELPQLPIKICPIVADAYQPAEKQQLLTRRCLEAIADGPAGWVPMVLTRSTLLARDIDVLQRIPGSWAGVSLPTLDDTVRRHFEPRASSVAERLALLGALRTAGVNAVAVVQPMMEGPVVALADALAASADAVVIDVLEGEEGAHADFDAEGYSETRTEQWQRERALALRALLVERGVTVWEQDLPPQYCGPRS